MITRVLLGLTGAEHAQAAIDHALDLATAHQAAIDAIGFCYRPMFVNASPAPPGGMAWARVAAENAVTCARKRITTAANMFEGLSSQAGIRHSITIEEREPIDALADHWRFVDLVVFPRRSLFDQGLVDEPVGTLNRMVGLGIRPTVAAGSAFRPVRRALAALSGSTVSAKVFKRFCQMKPWGTLPIDLVHVSRNEVEGRRLLERSAAFAAGHGMVVEQQIVRPGNPSRVILETAADTGADVIVLGDSSRSLVARRCVGDVALDALRNSELPLFLSH